VHDGHNVSTPKVTNISSISGMTHSGHVFTFLKLRVESKDKGKVKENVTEVEKIGLMVNDKVHRKKPEGKR